MLFVRRRAKSTPNLAARLFDVATKNLVSKDEAELCMHTLEFGPAPSWDCNVLKLFLRKTDNFKDSDGNWPMIAYLELSREVSSFTSETTAVCLATGLSFLLLSIQCADVLGEIVKAIKRAHEDGRRKELSRD